MAFEKVDLPDPEDTIVALCSAPGAGTRAIVRLSGPEAHRITAAIFRPIDGDSSTSPAQADRRRVIPGSVFLQGVSAPLPAWLYRFFAPRSYTGQDMAEIHTLGSPPLVEHLIAELLRSGARAARPGEFTLRAFLAGKKDLAQAEAIRAVIEADDQSGLQRALQQLAGGLSGPLQAWRPIWISWTKTSRSLRLKKRSSEFKTGLTACRDCYSNFKDGKSQAVFLGSFWWVPPMRVRAVSSMLSAVPKH